MAVKKLTEKYVRSVFDEMKHVSVEACLFEIRDMIAEDSRVKDMPFIAAYIIKHEKLWKKC